MINIRSIKTVELLDVVEAAGEDAWGGTPIWDEMIHHGYGNQRFANDSIFRYVLPDDELSPVQQRIKSLCWAAIEDEDTIYFDVSW